MAYNKAPTKEELRKWGKFSRKGDKIKFVDIRFRLRAHGSGSILDLFSFRSDPYRSRVHSTRTDPTQRSTDVK